MGLFSGQRRLFPSSELHSPIRLHSELTLEILTARIVAGCRNVSRLAVAATNDARVVGTLLVLAAIALAVEMARSLLWP
jgi:hypothetical protein